MEWLVRMFTLPASRNSLADILGKGGEQDARSLIEFATAFLRRQEDLISDGKIETAANMIDDAERILTDPGALFAGAPATDPLKGVREIARDFARRWSMDWPHE